VSDDKLRPENPLKPAANSRAAQIYRTEFVVNRKLLRALLWELPRRE
jgi:hypothetical protein